MKKLLFILLAISMFSCAKEENQNQSQTNINNNNNDTSKVEISLKRPDDADCNLTSKQQAKPAKKIDAENYEASLDNCTIQVKLKNEEASLINYISKTSTSTSKSKENTLLLPNMIWIEESWIQITSIGDTTKRKSVFGNFKVEAEEIQIPNTVKHIAAKAFSGCNNVSNIVMSQNLETIGENAFEFCSSLESIELPKSLEKLGNNAFESCAELKSISFESVPQMHIETIANIEKIEINATKFNEFKETFKEEISNSNLEDKIVAKEYVKCEDFSIKFLNQPTTNIDTIYLQIGEILEFEFETNPIEIDDKIYIQNYSLEELAQNPIETHWFKINHNTIEAKKGSPNVFVIGYHIGELEEKFVTIRIFEKLEIEEEISVFSASEFDFPVPTNLLNKDSKVNYFYDDKIVEKSGDKYIITNALYGEDIKVDVKVEELGINRTASFTIKPKVVITSPLEATVYQEKQIVNVYLDKNYCQKISTWWVGNLTDNSICSLSHSSELLVITPLKTGDAQVSIEATFTDKDNNSHTIKTILKLHCIYLEGTTIQNTKSYTPNSTVDLYDLIGDNSVMITGVMSDNANVTYNKSYNTINLPSEEGGAIVSIYGTKKGEYVKYNVAIKWIEEIVIKSEWEAFEKEVEISQVNFILDKSNSTIYTFDLDYPQNSYELDFGIELINNENANITCQDVSGTPGHVVFSIKCTENSQAAEMIYVITLKIKFHDQEEYTTIKETTREINVKITE